MAPPSTTDSTDPILPGINNGSAGDGTLAVGHDTSLTLATDSLIVLGTLACGTQRYYSEKLTKVQMSIQERVKSSIVAVYFPPVVAPCLINQIAFNALF